MGPRAAKTWDDIVREVNEDSNNLGHDDGRSKSNPDHFHSFVSCPKTSKTALLARVMGWTFWHNATGFPEWSTICENDQEALPNYTDHLLPSAPITPPSNQDGFDAPPSYDAAMRGEN